MADCCEVYHEEPPKQPKKKEKPRDEEEKRPRETKKVDQLLGENEMNIDDRVALSYCFGRNTSY